MQFYVLDCYQGSSPTFFWQITIFVYLAILQVVGILLAFQTRRVKMKGLNDSKLVAMIIYISSIVIVALALVKFGLRAFINVGTGITVAGIFTLSTIILGLNFVPKVWCTMTVIIVSTLKKLCTQCCIILDTTYIHFVIHTLFFSLSLSLPLFISLSSPSLLSPSF